MGFAKAVVARRSTRLLTANTVSRNETVGKDESLGEMIVLMAHKVAERRVVPSSLYLKTLALDSFLSIIMP